MSSITFLEIACIDRTKLHSLYYIAYYFSLMNWQINYSKLFIRWFLINSIFSTTGC